jgi:cytochrome c
MIREAMTEVAVLAAAAIGARPGSAADAAAGERVFRAQCATCHSAQAGVNKAGPSLSGVYGRQAGSTDFPRYRGLVGADFTWSAERLNDYLADPRAFVIANTANRYTGMSYLLTDATQRSEVIAYLQTLK